MILTSILNLLILVLWLPIEVARRGRSDTVIRRFKHTKSPTHHPHIVALSIVPLMGLFTGNPPVEKLDLGQTVALFSTGVVWSFYATIIRPQWSMFGNSNSKECGLVLV